MSAKVVVYALWFLFGLWSYVTFIYVVGFVWFLTIKTRKRKYDFLSNFLDIFFWIFTFVGQILTIYLYVDSGKDLINSGSNPTTFYWVVLIYNFVTVIFYIFFLFFFSNNFEVKFTEEKFYIVSVSVLNSSIIKVARNSRNHLIVEYVYKKEVNKIWTEKLIFHKWFTLAKFIEDNYLAYFDPEKNKTLLEISKVTKLVQKTDSEVTDAADLKIKKSIKKEKSSLFLSDKKSK